jgi:hypothetical protein
MTTLMSMLRLETKPLPMVWRKTTGSIPAMTAVTTAAIMMVRMESHLRANPTTTIRIPSSFISSM